MNIFVWSGLWISIGVIHFFSGQILPVLLPKDVIVFNKILSFLFLINHCCVFFVLIYLVVTSLHFSCSLILVFRVLDYDLVFFSFIAFIVVVESFNKV